MGSLIWSLFLFILAFGLVIGLLIFTLQVLRRQMAPGGGGRYLETLDALPLGRERSLHLVRFGGQVYLLGVTGQGIETLATVEASELGPPRETAGEGFGATLEKVLGSNNPFMGRLKREEIEKRLDNLGQAIKRFRQGRGGGPS